MRPRPGHQESNEVFTVHHLRAELQVGSRIQFSFKLGNKRCITILSQEAVQPTLLRERLIVSRFARLPMSGREASWLRDTSSNLRLFREERAGRLASWAGRGLQG